MAATILLDNRHAHYTNLDFLSGKVILNLPSETAVGGIQVKLEGESRTRLSGPRYPNNVNSEKKRTELEVHKVSIATVEAAPSVSYLLTVTDSVQGRDCLPHGGCYAVRFTSVFIHHGSGVIRIPVPIQGQSRLAGTLKAISDVQVVAIQ